MNLHDPIYSTIARHHRQLLHSAHIAQANGDPIRAQKYRDQAARQGHLVGLPISPTGPKIRKAQP